MANINFKNTPSIIQYLDISYGENSIRFQLVEDVLISWDHDKTYIMTIPKGFTTDFASIPVIFRNIISPLGGYDSVTLAHDYLYSNHIVNRKKADYMLREGSIQKGLSKPKAWLMWVLVRIFGRFYWKK